MDWTEECELAKQFAVALVTRNGVSNAGAAQAQGEDIANQAFILARVFAELEPKKADEWSAAKKAAATKK
jgi:hypothetical protein